MLWGRLPPHTGILGRPTSAAMSTEPPQARIRCARRRGDDGNGGGGTAWAQKRAAGESPVCAPKSTALLQQLQGYKAPHVITPSTRPPYTSPREPLYAGRHEPNPNNRVSCALVEVP